MPEADKQNLFDSAGTDVNLDAVKELRNAVSHHKFLKMCQLKSCIVDGNKSDSLIANIQNLRQLLPIQYRFGEKGVGGITKDLQMINVYLF